MHPPSPPVLLFEWSYSPGVDRKLDYRNYVKLPFVWSFGGNTTQSCPVVWNMAKQLPFSENVNGGKGCEGWSPPPSYRSQRNGVSRKGPGLITERIKAVQRPPHRARSWYVTGFSKWIATQKRRPQANNGGCFPENSVE